MTMKVAELLEAVQTTKKIYGMSFNEYQAFAKTTWTQTDDDTIALAICGLGAAGEAGEVADKIKKIIHYHQGVMQEGDKEALVKEIGDVLWYLANLCSWLNVNFGDVAEANRTKLLDRQKRDVLRGEGDER